MKLVTFGEAQARVGERDALTRLVRAAALEVLAHRRDVEDGDLIASEHPDSAVALAESDELHACAFRRLSLC